MRVHAITSALVLSASTSLALKFPVKRLSSTSPSFQKRSGAAYVSRPVLAVASQNSDPDAASLNSVHDLIYLANITVGSSSYDVQLDTGSSDLWIKGPSSPLPGANVTDTTYNLTYGIGWAYGNVAYAPVVFAGIKITSQGYIDVTSAQNPALGYGAAGIAGLGFTSLSTVDALVNHTGADTGRSLLFNAFDDNPSEPNYIAFSLQRDADPDHDVQGTFSIGEVEPQYADVLKSDPVPTWPPSSPSRWNILLDAVLVGSKTIPVSSTVAGAPSGKAVVLLDTGTSYVYAPEDVCTAIYSGVPGAKFDSGLGQWVVPCDQELDVALQIGGKVYPLHPLDVTPPSLTDPTTCVGSFVPQSVSVGAGQFDWLIGDAVLRSVYAIYDFGDFDSTGKMGNPYVKLLSLIDPNEASDDFHQVRGGAPAGNVTYNASNSTSSSGSTTVQVSDDLSKTLDKIGTFFPIMLAVMGLNALVIILLLAAAVVYMCRRKKGPRARKNIGRMSPMPMGGLRSSTFDMHPITDPHTYQPVSMALTEDTFVPPTPAFSKPGYDDSGMRGGMGDRPKSVA